MLWVVGDEVEKQDSGRNGSEFLNVRFAGSRDSSFYPKSLSSSHLSYFFFTHKDNLDGEDEGENTTFPPSR
jgi:hypothetical protein